jgi:dienelactone hydrolase
MTHLFVLTMVAMLATFAAHPAQTSAPTTAQAPAAGAAAAPYETIFYTSTQGGLKLEAYFYKPATVTSNAAQGPLPLVIYNHGSRAGTERNEVPMAFVATMLTGAGYAVLVPERRGYGKSDGPTFSEEIGTDRGPRFLARLDAEADDVLAALEYAKAHLPIDPKRVAIMGWSFGGIVTTLAAGRSDGFVATITQAPAALNWDQVPPLREQLIAAAAKTKAPVLCMAARNDATTENAKSICGAVKDHGGSSEVIIYPPFEPPQPVGNIAPGHLIFGRFGVDRWSKDVLAFLAKHMR